MSLTSSLLCCRRRRTEPISKIAPVLVSTTIVRVITRDVPFRPRQVAHCNFGEVAQISVPTVHGPCALPARTRKLVETALGIALRSLCVGTVVEEALELVVRALVSLRYREPLDRRPQR